MIGLSRLVPIKQQSERIVPTKAAAESLEFKATFHVERNSDNSRTPEITVVVTPLLTKDGTKTELAKIQNTYAVEFEHNDEAISTSEIISSSWPYMRADIVHLLDMYEIPSGSVPYRLVSRTPRASHNEN